MEGKKIAPFGGRFQNFASKTWENKMKTSEIFFE